MASEAALFRQHLLQLVAKRATAQSGFQPGAVLAMPQRSLYEPYSAVFGEIGSYFMISGDICLDLAECESTFHAGIVNKHHSAVATSFLKARGAREAHRTSAQHSRGQKRLWETDT